MHQRRCENKKMAVHDHKDEPKTRRRWGSVFACCTDVNVREPDGANGEVVRKPVRKRILSGVTWKKKTVPIETANKTKDCGTEMVTTMTTRRFSDGNKENTCNRHDETDGCSVQITTQEEQRSMLSSKSVNAASTVLPVHDVNSGDDHLSKSAPLCSRSTADFKLHIGNCNSPQSSHYATPDASPSVLDTDSGTTGEPDSSKLLPVLTVAALLVLLFGRGFAVFSMCVYFYMVSRFRSEYSTENRGETKKGIDEVDLNSARHKKTVVLRGFLERPKKKPVVNVTNLQSSSS